jgi:hypothetical protein
MKLVPAIMALALFAAAYSPRNDFSVFIRIYTRGTSPLWTYRLTGDSISVTRHFTDGRRDSTALRRALTGLEIRRLDRFFTGFPLGGIKARYVDETVDGESCVCYIVKVNRNEKECYVCYARPAELAGLNRAINRLLPRRYRLWTDR